ncbi:MAG: hypothetical protein QOG53_1304 [Frankiales bacterium]|nr:hypothetical protein [Frankiales bacterium]
MIDVLVLLPGVSSSDHSKDVLFQLYVGVTALVFALVIGVLLLAVVFFRRERQPEEGRRTLETRDDSPAVAALLVHTREVPGEAAAATLVDLAARGTVEILDMGGGTPAVRLLETAPLGLRAYEQRVFELVRRHADGDGVAPADALTLSDDEASEKWLEEFRSEVRDEARSNGWVRKRYGTEVSIVAVLLLIGAVVIAIWGYATATKFPADVAHPPTPHSDLRAGLVWAAVLLGGAEFVAISALWRSAAQRLTRSGRPVAASWLGVAAHLRDDEQLAEAPPTAVAIWHRLLAYATGFGVAHAVQERIPLGPESRSRAWSAESGRWRQVRVRYPERWPPGWGSRPGELVKYGAGRLLMVGVPVVVILTVGVQLIRAGVLDSAPWWSVAFAGLVAGPFLLLAAAGIVNLLFGLVMLASLFGPPREVTGLAVRVRPIPGQTAGMWVAIDDGTRDEVVAYKVRVSNSIQQGDHVRLLVRPLSGQVLAAADSTEPVGAATR